MITETKTVLCMHGNSVGSMCGYVGILDNQVENDMERTAALRVCCGGYVGFYGEECKENVIGNLYINCGLRVIIMKDNEIENVAPQVLKELKLSYLKMDL